LTVSINNTLLKDIEATYSFIDPTTYASEVTREFLYQNTNFLQYSFIKDFIYVVNKYVVNTTLNFNLLNNYFLYSLGTPSNNLTLGKNSDLYKSQYRPMKKGISNMIRLQATNAIAMPTEIRLHILASSKDVIHS
jgi:hypothetical protein